MININAKNAESRSSRLDAITNYDGTYADLIGWQCHGKGDGSGRGCGQGFGRGCGCGSLESRTMNQCSCCASHTSMITLSHIRNICMVDHAPIGCISSSIQMNNLQNKRGKMQRGLPQTNLRIFSTNMNETDSVFGAAGKLEATIREAYRRYHPDAILVTTSCVSGIIGEDVTSVTDAMAEELGVPILPVFCEGIKSKVWADGFDAGQHAILKYLVKEPEKKTNKVNFINFYSGMKGPMTEMLASIGLEPQFIANFATVEELSHISEATATATICGTVGTYLGQALEERYGIPFLGEIPPHGVAKYEELLRALAKIVGREDDAEAFIAAKREKFMPRLAELREQLTGLHAVIGMGPGFAFSYIPVMEELGITVDYVIGFHYDKYLDGNRKTIAESIFNERYTNMKASIADLQNFEILRIINELKPDIFINRHNNVGGDCMKLGVPLLFLGNEYSAFGYEPMIALGERILDITTNRNLYRNLASHAKIPYKREWLERELTLTGE